MQDLRVQLAALRYTGRWHRVRHWAEDALERPGFEDIPHHVIKYAPKQNGTRVERLAVSHVRDLNNEEEAYDAGIPLELLEDFARGPGRVRGGLRRVVITALTWVLYEDTESVDDAAWITLGQGFTAKQAVERAHRFVRDYEQSLIKRTYSRKLVYTALEIKYWTAKQGSTYI